MQKLKADIKGFTLIELMIVIAIIGVLAAIAIPNFITYRNKAFCTRAERDANGVAGSVSDYFSMPRHTQTPELTELNEHRGFRLSGAFGVDQNSCTITGNDPNINITITVRDGSRRCPASYQRVEAVNTANRAAGWDGNGIFYKYINATQN